MARIESIARAGYFPSPPRVVRSIARMLDAPPMGGRRVMRLLDPCAGMGDAAAHVGTSLGAETYGIELHTERAAIARSQLNHVLATSAFSVRVANGAFSCLYLNPPYDQETEQRRLEHAFLTAFTRVLCPSGVLVFIIPQRQLAVSARYLASHYQELVVYRFPDPEFAAFNQVVLFACRKHLPGYDAQTHAQVEAWSAADLPPLPDDPTDGPCYPPPLQPAGNILFASLFFDADQAAAEAQQRGVWSQPQLIDQLWSADVRPVRPLMPLRRGHLALLIAGGLLNNVVLRQGGRHVLVKGRTYKELVEIDNDDDRVLVEREVLHTSVTVLDLDTGMLEVIRQGATGAEAV